MTFAQPVVLWGLAGPILAGVTLFVLAFLRRRRGWTLWPGITRVVAIGGRVHPVGVARGTRRPWLLLIALTLALLALAGPRWGVIEEPVYQKSREVMIALDLSRSMLADDVLPSRLERSRLLVRSLLDALRGERVGLIVFAGTAFVQVPMSTDYQILEEFLPELNPEYMPQGGTDFEGMLRSAIGGFSAAADTDRYLIVLSDGEAQDEAWREQLAGVKEKGIHAITFGVGTLGGAFIPDAKTGAFVKDARGAVVLSKLEPATLQALAAETGGAYRDASAWIEIAAVLQETIERGRQGAFTEKRSARAIERFQWFLAPALLFALLGVWREIPVRPRPRQVRAVNTRGRSNASGAVSAMIVVLVTLAWAGAGLPRLSAAVQDTTPVSAEEKLRSTVTRLAASENVAPAGWKAMAEQTLTLAGELQQKQQPVPPGVVHDALAAVDAGERRDPRATDWAGLREQLQRLLEPPPQPEQPPEQKPEEKEDQEKQDEKQNEQSPQQQQDSSSNQKDQQQSDQQQQPSESGDSDEKSDTPQKQQKQDDPTQKQQDQSSSNKQEPQKEDSGIGEMQKPEEQPQPEPQAGEDKPAAPKEAPKTRKFGGAQDSRQKQSAENPELAAALARLEQVEESDSPARLHQRLEEEARRNERPSPASTNPHDW